VPRTDISMKGRGVRRRRRSDPVGRLRLPVGLLFVGAALLVAPAVAAAAVVGGPSAASSGLTARSSLDQEILAQINRVREGHGLNPLRLARSLAVAAIDHSQEMAEGGFFGHDSADGSAYWERIRRFYRWMGFSRWAVGENVFWASPDASALEVVQDWMRSPPHRRILLYPGWRDLGVAAIHDSRTPGAYQGLEVTIVTVDFGARSR
jgi:uncharacterized protein YkwD